MKVTFYLDVWKGWTPEYAVANTRASYDPPKDGTRLRFEVEIPDHYVKYKEGDWISQRIEAEAAQTPTESSGGQSE